MGIRFSQLKVLGPGGLLQQLTRGVTVGRRLGGGGGSSGGGGEELGPEVVLFDPGEEKAHPGLPAPPEGLPYTRVAGGC